MSFRPAQLAATVLVCCAFSIHAQESKELTKPNFITHGTFLGSRPSLASQLANGTFLPGEEKNAEVNPKHSDGNRVIPGKGLPKDGDPLADLQRNQLRLPPPEPSLVFQAATSDVTPTDPNGAVGPDHYMNSWNSSFRIYSKLGVAMIPTASLATIWPGETSGDPIVMYDRYADRFVITQFSFNNSFLVAVTQGPDPVNDGWYTYEFGVDEFPDYPKYSVWSDGYYVTANKNSGSASTSDVVYALERDEILSGGNNPQMVGFPLPGIVTDGFYSPLGFNANGLIPPPPGNAPIIYLQDDAWGGINTDHLKIWSIHVNWANVNSSTISNPEILNTQPFDGVFDGGSFSNLPSPGADLDALQATIMYMAQYRQFGAYNSCVLNYVVDLDGNDDLAGIRWFELRQDSDGEPWSIFQEGTYVQPDGLSAWCGSICQDYLGNIGMGFTVCGPNDDPSLRFTGRYSTDPLGTMTLGEGIITQGTDSPGFFRYGDYAQLTVDPLDDCTFWHIGETFGNGTRKNTVGVFKLGSLLNNDVGVISIDTPQDGTLTANETISVTLRNYGLDPQTNFPVSYQVDAGPVITENYVGTLNPAQVAPFTFATTSDFSVVGQTYTIWASTELTTDENIPNNALSTDVTHLNPNDIGVTGITSPVTGPGLGSNVPVTVTIHNFGASTQTNFDVTFEFDGGAPVTEVVSQSLPGLGSITYTFTATVDFPNLGNYTLLVYTSLPGDIDTSNDPFSAVITKELCQPGADCSFGDGFQILVLEDINNNSGCDPGGYGDYTNLSTGLAAGGTYDLGVTTGYGDQHVRCWVDFNDNFQFEFSELTVNNYVIAPGQGGGSYSATIPFFVYANAPLGQHLMRAKTNWTEDVAEACDEYPYGETEDYTVEVTPVGVEENPFGDSELTIATLGGNQFMAELQAVRTPGTVIIRIYDINGKLVVENKVHSTNNVFRYPINMSYAAKGTYLVRMGTYDYGKIRKIVVE